MVQCSNNSTSKNYISDCPVITQRKHLIARRFQCLAFSGTSQHVDPGLPLSSRHFVDGEH
eukprot:scaffold1783_cov199-Chaetoceros_neogracile.AAC.2